MKKIIWISAIMLLLSSSFGSLALQNGYDQFQKALAKERGEGNLEEAVALYQKVINETKDEALAAQAQLRIGFCYEKLGREEARKAFQKVVDKYPAQIDSVKMAREKLSLLEKGQTAQGKGDSQTRLRLVWEGPEVELMGSPSPDGRYICYTDWDTGDLAIHDFSTGEKRRLTGQIAWDGSWVENSRWSPDGKLIAYTWDTGVTAELRIIGLDGSKPRVLLRGVYPSVKDWSPDGQQILAVVYAGSGQSYSLVAVSDGSVRQLKKIDSPAGYMTGIMEFSPDGRHIAFDHQNDIYLLSADGKTEIPLVKHPANDRLLGWTPDGKYILFASDRSGAMDAWILPMMAGKPGPEPELIKKDIGAVSPLGFTRDGDFFYGHGKDMQRIYVATVDRKAGTLSATYQKMELPYEGRNHAAEFSPDGKRLAFVRSALPRKDGSKSLYISSLETGEERKFVLNLREVNSLAWAPDGSSVMFWGYQDQRTIVGRIDTRTGEIGEIFSSDKDARQELYVSPAWSPDGRIVYCVRGANMATPESSLSIIAKELSSGRTWNVYQWEMGHPNFPVISVSPDGELLAVFEHPKGNKGAEEKILKVISTKGGDVRELCRFASAVNSVLRPRWSADGRYIFFPGQRKGEEKWDLWAVPAEGGEPRGLGLALHRINYISPHPDGSRIVFSSLGPTIHGPEVWVMENFLPAKRESKKGK